MNRELKLVLFLAVAMLLLAQAFPFVGIAPSPSGLLIDAYRRGYFIIYVGTLSAFFFVLHAFSRPGWRELAIVAAAGTVFSVYWLSLLPYNGVPAFRTWYHVAVPGAGLGIASLVVLARRAYGITGPASELARTLLAACGFIALFSAFTSPYLAVSAALHPATFDTVAYHFDGTLGFQPSITVALLAGEWPWLMEVLTTAYNVSVYGVPALYALQLTRARPAPASLLLVWTVGTALAFLAYHLYPVSGPQYVFGNLFPAFMPPDDQVPLATVVVGPAARNGVPSMHFGWTLAVWINATLLNMPMMRAVSAVLMGLTGLATLALGEHYLVDLVVAVPFMLAIQGLCTQGLPWSNRARRDAVVVGAALFFAWVLMLRFGIELFLSVPGFSWLAIIATLAASVVVCRRLLRESANAVVAPQAASPQPLPAPLAGARREVRYVAAMFVVSGFAGLMYQVLFSKALALTFGSTSTATYTVLATFMGGMALGAWLGGRVAARRNDALRLYAFCELGIGIYCLATPLIFKAIQSLYVALAAGVPPDAGVLTVFRVLLGATALTVPTVLMGMTLPILAKFFEGRAASLGRSVAVLYGANTVGAAFGALFAGYLVIPLLGVLRTTLTAALANFFVVLLALRLQKELGGQPQQGASVLQARFAATLDGVESRRLGYVALVLLTVGGVVTLALEVNYIHLLAVVAGNSVYAFSLMLFAFLLGLGAGAEIARRLLRLEVSLVLALAWIEFALAAVVLGGVFLWEGLPAYFASFAAYPLARDFGAREVVRGLVCWIAMFPPAVAIGAAYPLAMECVGRAFADRQIQALGRAAALNTAGNIAGVLLAGFVLLPTIGALRSIQLLAATSLLLGVLVLGASALRWRPKAWAPAALVVLLAVAQPRQFDYTALASGANVYFQPQSFGRVIDHAESVDGGLTTVSVSDGPDRKPLLTLLTNGKFQGNDALDGEMLAQVGFALSPLLHAAHRDRALVIGFGTGVSARTLHAAGFKELDIVDLSADILRLAATYFAKVNDDVIRKPGVRTHVTDGRNFLMLQERRYDVVSMEVSSIWFAGAASLYNREFYALVKRRLAPHGVLQQWMQLHHLTPIDVLYIMGSVRAEFEYVWLYLVGGQGMIIASNDANAAATAENVAKLDATPALKPLLYDGSAASLLKTRLLDPAATDRLLDVFGVPLLFWVSTDDNLFLEYSTPKGNALDGGATRDQNLEFIRGYGGSLAAHAAK